jgi:hypothetical protein
MIASLQISVTAAPLKLFYRWFRAGIDSTNRGARLTGSTVFFCLVR